MKPATKATFEILDGFLTKVLAPIFLAQKKKIAALEADIAALKARPLQKWAGTHVTGMQYSEASLVTRSGSLWVATATTTTTPGEASGEWRLIVKKGHA